MKNAAYVALLNAAKDNLWMGEGPYDGKDIYICFCIDIAVQCFCPQYDEESYRLKELIQTRLGKHSYTVTEWLHREHNVPLSAMSDVAVQEYRLAWMNELIKEFS